MMLSSIALAAVLATAADAAQSRPSPPDTTVVTPSRLEENSIDAPATTTVIGEGSIRTSAARNVADLLRTVSGLNAIQLSARDVNVSARRPTGVLAGGMLAMVDGRPLNHDGLDFMLWDS